MGDSLLRFATAERQHVNRGKLEVQRHAHLGHRERVAAQHLVEDLAALEDVGKRMADHLTHLELALRGSLGGLRASHVMPLSLAAARSNSNWRYFSPGSRAPADT